MGSARLRQGIAAAAAAAAIGLHATAAVAGNMSLTISGITGAIDVGRFDFDISRRVGDNKTYAGDPAFTAPESAATPLELLWVATGNHATTAVLQIVSPVTGQLTADWTFTDVRMTSVTVDRAPGGSPTTKFSFAIGKYSYRVYNPNGSTVVACWDVSRNLKC
jgi:hypothetical protein